MLSLAESIAAIDRDAFEHLLAAMRLGSHEPGSLVISAGQRDPGEYFVLSGIVKTFVGDADGREVTLAFHVGPCALTPSIARVADECSRVSCVAMTQTRVAGFPASTLVECMLRNPSIQRWGDTVLRADLVRRADREWALAALPTVERLLRFRRDHPGLEDLIAHHHIASYLGITPVTLSRARAQLRERA
ncbi:Crp/Fnr family transcriptional regulator [Piscinibacter sp.]|uniref:Crp/Fnr family transcriptional regulator n=1 Tax=Piscinibacter sp. TaxID=1903157 RepID=UPI002B85BAAE|nr:Crp/Fnr family transcriptional regulator [Albitalea sp.]HUG20934.1 Crp/Fnr family transcriptional regulator [Albitalea sp.]